MKLFVILGNQLFDPSYLKKQACTDVYMAEDLGLCTFQKHHKLKLYLFLTAMREYRDELEAAGINVHYKELDIHDQNTYVDSLYVFLENKTDTVNFFEIEDKPFEKNFLNLESKKINLVRHQSPMFLFSRKEFAEFHEGKKNFRMAPFYKYGRKKLNLLVDDQMNPVGEKWSFDEENRKKIPKSERIPELLKYEVSKYHNDIKDLIDKNFNGHPGNLSNIWFPVTRQQSKISLNIFIEERLNNFGIYEDAMVNESNFLFHSTLSPALNIGLLTPDEVIKKCLKSFEKLDAPLNSVEGFIRQVIGWREFIRGIYQTKGEYQQSVNFWKHERKLSDSWYEGTTGILPLDDCIKSTIKDGYHHHIPRLMIISNLMNMCEVDPDEIYKWFMEMYIDSSDWVMTPNVYGMATFSDGGLMSTKPYTCGSNYILKMSNYPRGDWCDIVDGLYWRFTDKHRSFYEKNARMSFLTRSLDRMNIERKEMIFSKADKFIEGNTI
tara:strand:- start:884 stop:2362 length:1479 start_codon:yes stop_codon:yes gene_type:complete